MKTTHKKTNIPFPLNLDDIDYCRGIAYIDFSVTFENDADPTTDVALIEREKMEVEVTSINSVSVVLMDKVELEIKPPKMILDKMKHKIQSEIEVLAWEEIQVFSGNI